MPLTLEQTEIDLLRRCLAARWLGARPTDTLKFYLSVEEVAAIPNFSSNQDYIEWTIAHARETGFAKQPAFIVSIAGLFPFDANAVALAAKLKAQQEQYLRELPPAAAAAAPVDPFRPVVMRRLQPVLGREDACTALKMLARPDDAAIFVVAGTPRSGRSYTVELVNHAVWHLGGSRQLSANVAPAEGDESIVDRYEAVSYIASTLVDQIDRRELQRGRSRSSPVPPLVNDGRDLKWLRAAADAVVSAAANTGEAWWLVLDRVLPDTAEAQDPAVDSIAAASLKGDPVDAFIQILTRKIAKLFSGHQIRLIVLGYKRDFPSDVGPAVVREHLPPPASVGQTEVEAFFKRFFESRGGWQQNAVDGAVSEVFERLTTRLDNTSDHLSSLNASIREVLHDLA